MSRDEVEFAVGPEEAGERVDRLVASRLGIARSKLDADCLKVDGRVVRGAQRVAVGSVVSAVVDLGSSAIEPNAEPLDVVREDSDFVVIDKPAGLIVHPRAGDLGAGDSVVHRLSSLYPELVDLADEAVRERPGIVHRLDRETSGLLVVARSQRSYEALSAMVRAHALHREYAVLVSGEFDVDEGLIDAPIGRRPGSRNLSVRADGRPSRTRYSVEATWQQPKMAALTVRLETGRMHQIRVHLSDIGHPVVGDRQYGGRLMLGAKRQFLHSHRLAFDHPFETGRIDLASVIPADLEAVLANAPQPASGAIPPSWISGGESRSGSESA